MFNLNIDAEEFVPSENSPYMMEMKWFDELETNFVLMNKWIFEYDEASLNELVEEIDEIEFIYECYKYDDNKFKKNVFKPELETISEEDENKKSYVECVKNN